MYKVIILIILTSSTAFAQDRNDLEYLQAIPPDYQGVYESIAVSTDSGQSYIHQTAVMGIVKDTKVIEDKDYYPTAIYMVEGKTLMLYFYDIKKSWRVSKVVDGRCEIIIEDTNKDIEIQRWLVKVSK